MVKEFIEAMKLLLVQWRGTSIAKGNFDSISLLLMDRELAHIHYNGDLDIIFGTKLSAILVAKGWVKKHAYVSRVGITYSILSQESIEFGIQLVRLSYALYLNQNAGAKVNDSAAIEQEVGQLPLQLIEIYRDVTHQ